jgi:hypothetical protein
MMATADGDETYRIVNGLAQGSIAMQEASQWFAQLSGEAQWAALLKATEAISQAHPVPADASTAIGLSGLRPTCTPCVLLKAHPLPDALARIRRLPAGEWAKAFQLFLALFAIADERRRNTRCKGACSHPWHSRHA